MFKRVVTNAPFICKVEKAVETSVYVTEFAVIRIRAIAGLGRVYYGLRVETGSRSLPSGAPGGRARSALSSRGVTRFPSNLHTAHPDGKVQGLGRV